MCGIAKYLRWRFVGKQNYENSILSVNGNNTHINVFGKAVEFIDDCTALWLISYYTVSRPSILFEFCYRGEFGKKKISIFDGKENSVKLKDTANASSYKYNKQKLSNWHSWEWKVAKNKTEYQSIYLSCSVIRKQIEGKTHATLSLVYLLLYFCGFMKFVSGRNFKLSFKFVKVWNGANHLQTWMASSDLRGLSQLLTLMSVLTRQPWVNSQKWHQVF